MRRDIPETIEPNAPTLPWPATWSVAGVIAALEPLVLPERRQRIEQVVAERIGSVTLLMDAPHDPHNGAAVLRSCEAFGVHELHVVPREESFQIARRVTKGAERWVDSVVHAAPHAAVRHLKQENFTLVATHPGGELTPNDLGRIDRVALILGNEHDGIRDALMRAADRTVRIAMRGFVESLNVSVSAAILLHAATHGRRGDLDSEQRRRLYAKGLFRTVPRAPEVLSALTPS